MPQRIENPLVGVCPIIEVPFDADENIALDDFVRVVRHVTGTGVGGVMVPGFASEYYKLADDERRTLIRTVVEIAAETPDVVCVASVPDHSTRLAVDRAQESVELGVRMLNVLPPHFLGPPAAAVVGHLDAVLAAVSPTPVMVQYAPMQTGVALSAGTLRDLARAHSNLVAVKVEAVPPGRVIEELANSSVPIPALVGHAGVQLPDAFVRGAVGVQPGCSFTEIYVAIWAAAQAGEIDRMRQLHRRLLPYISYWMQDVELMIAAEKYISWRRGLIGSPVCRRPNRALDQTELSMIENFLSEFAELCPGAEMNVRLEP